MGLISSLFGISSRRLRRGSALAADASAVLDFVRGRLDFIPRPDDIFVASYPRSGTTWIQFILQQVATRGQLGFEHITQVAPWFERSLAIGEKTARDYEEYPSPRIFKTHLLPRWLPPAGRSVYVVRDGMDVLASYYAFYRSHLAFTGSLEEFFERFVAGHLQYGSWAEHVAAWRAVEHRPDVLVVAYEDLQRSFTRTVRELADFCDLPLDDDLLALVRERCSIGWMKEHESLFDHLTSILMERGIEPRSFVRRGRVGEGREILTAEQRRTIIELGRQRREAVLPVRRLADFLR